MVGMQFVYFKKKGRKKISSNGRGQRLERRKGKGMER
jgi:hypothetical protein